MNSWTKKASTSEKKILLYFENIISENEDCLAVSFGLVDSLLHFYCQLWKYVDVSLIDTLKWITELPERIVFYWSDLYINNAVNFINSIHRLISILPLLVLIVIFKLFQIFLFWQTTYMYLVSVILRFTGNGTYFIKGVKKSTQRKNIFFLNLFQILLKILFP